AAYCAAIADTVRFGIAEHLDVLVVSPPFVSHRHEQQQRSLEKFLERQFGHERQFAYLDLGRAIPLSDPVQSPDGIHRTEIGNHLVAQRIARMLVPWLGPDIIRSRAGGS